MVEDLREAGVISSYSPEDITTLARTITDIIGNRTFDIRRRRIIVNYGKGLEEAEIKAAMEQVKIVDLVQWPEKNLPLSTKAQRRRLLKNVG